MKCEKCKEREATFFYSSNYNGKKIERHLCTNCAREEGFGEMLKSTNVFDDAFDSIFNDFFSPMRSFRALPSFDLFSKGLHSIMTPALPRLHFILEEKEPVPAIPMEESESKIPSVMDESLRKEREKAALKAQLEDAVKAEDYEQAIILRDKLREMEK